MRTLVGVASIAVVAAACASSTSAGSGPTPAESHWDTLGVLSQSIPCDTPAVIRAGDERGGARAEHDFLQKHYPGSVETMQALLMVSGRPMDELTIHTPDGTTYSVCFDTSSFYGRF